MAFIIDTAYDSGLSYLDTNGTRLDICSAEPTTYALATTTNSLGNDTVNCGAPVDGAVNGRRVIVPAITAGSVTADGSAAFWALTDGASILLATGSITTPQAVTNTNTFTLDAISIGFLDAASA